MPFPAKNLVLFPFLHKKGWLAVIYAGFYGGEKFIGKISCKILKGIYNVII